MRKADPPTPRPPLPPVFQVSDVRPSASGLPHGKTTQRVLLPARVWRTGYQWWVVTLFLHHLIQPLQQEGFVPSSRLVSLRTSIWNKNGCWRSKTRSKHTKGSKRTLFNRKKTDWARQKQINGLALHLICHRFHRLTVVCVSLCSLKNGIIPTIRMLCFVLINSVLSWQAFDPKTMMWC